MGNSGFSKHNGLSWFITYDVLWMCRNYKCDWILLWDAMQFLYRQAFHWHCTCLPGFDSPWQCDRLRWFAFNSRCRTSCVRPAMDCLKVSAYSLLLALVAQWQIDCVCSMLWLFTQCVLNIHVISMINCSSNKECFGVLWQRYIKWHCEWPCPRHILPLEQTKALWFYRNSCVGQLKYLPATAFLMPRRSTN